MSSTLRMLESTCKFEHLNSLQINSRVQGKINLLYIEIPKNTGSILSFLLNIFFQCQFIFALLSFIASKVVRFEPPFVFRLR